MVSPLESAKCLVVERLVRSAVTRAGGLSAVLDEDLGAAEDDNVEIELPCPYCFEEHQVASLLLHLEEEHSVEAGPAICPVCSDEVISDMARHITVQHGYLFKDCRRLPQHVDPAQLAIGLLGHEFREEYLHLLLGSEGHRPTAEPERAADISVDTLLSSFGLGFSTEADQTQGSSTCIVYDTSKAGEQHTQIWQNCSSLTREEREQHRRKARVRSTFVRDLLLSTLFED